MTMNDQPLDEIPTAICEPSEIAIHVERFEIQTGDIMTPPNRASVMMQKLCSVGMHNALY